MIPRSLHYILIFTCLLLINNILSTATNQEFIDAQLADGAVVSKKLESELFYSPPSLNIKDLNITIGISTPLSKTRGSFDYELYVGGIIATICQADSINQKLYPQGNFNGTINLAIQDYTFKDPLGQGGAMRLMLNDIFNRSTGQRLSDNNITNLSGFIGVESTGKNRVNADVNAGFIVPFVSPGTLSQIDPVDNYSIFPEIENRTFFTVRETIMYSNINVFVQLMNAYNWTIGANLFQNNVLGFDAQQGIQTYIEIKSKPVFTCNSIITSQDFFDKNFFIQYCNCISKVHDLNVIGVWAAPPLAYEIIKQINKYCSKSKDFIYIVSGENVELPNELSTSEEFKGSFIIRSYGPWNFTSYLDNCLEVSTETARKAVETLLDDVLQQTFNCYRVVTEETGGLEPCNEDVYNREVPCLCTGLEFDPRYNPYSSQNFFYSDAVSVYANAIQLLQTNCTKVNELFALRGNILSGYVDYCKLENLTPGFLNDLMILTNFTGYTGSIEFGFKFGNVRSYKNFYVYNVHTTIKDAVLVGNFSHTGYVLNYSDVVLPNGNNTISALVPQNPDLKYAAITVFFGILCLLVVKIIIATFILYKWCDHKLIRRNTPTISFAVLFGLFLVSVSGIIISTGVYDATCYLYVYMYYIGEAILLGGIIAKQYRIYKIFSNRSAVAVEIPDYKLFLIIFCITLYFFLLCCLSIVGDLHAAIRQSKTNQFYLFFRCVFKTETWTVFMAILAPVSLTILRLFACVMAWLTRRVNNYYSEAKPVIAVVVIYICLNISFTPLIESLKDGTDSAVIKACLALILIAITVTSTLVLLFYYRFYKVYKYEKKRRDRLSED